jgi:glycosyltransferase involved in cell wall biosynthesis
MKILFSTYPLAFQNPGGGEQIIDAIRSRLLERGHQVDFYGPWTHSPKVFLEYEVIHYFSCVETPFWRFVKAHAPRTPLVVTPTLFIQPGIKNRLRYLRQRAKWRALGQTSPYSWPDFWLPCTAFEGNSLVTHLSVLKEKVMVVPNGIEDRFGHANPMLFSALLGERFGGSFGAGAPFILHVGRFHPVKNHFKLIEAVRMSQTQIVFLGSADAENQDYFNECVKRSKQAQESDPTGKTRFLFLPALPHSDPLLASAYASCALFILPSDFETFGISAFEAALAGAPLALCNTIVTREVFARWAKFVNPKDSRSIASAIQQHAASGWPRVLTQERQERSEVISRQYSWNSIVDQITQVYQNLLRQ